MAGTKTSALAALTTVADGDLLPIVDISDTTQAPSGSTKKVTAEDVSAYISTRQSELNVRDGGVVGDGVTDDGVALNVFLAANPGRAIFIPPGFNVRTTVPINMASGITLRGYDAKLTNAAAGTSDRLLRFIGVTDCVVAGLELDGAKASFAPAAEHRHNLYLENADDITFRDVYSHNAKGDGFYVGDNNTVANYCQRIRLEGCTADANHRNGLSVVAVDGFVASDCFFINTSGTAPQAGFDVEPNASTGICRNVQIVNCVATGNVGGAIIQTHASAAVADQGGVSVVGCTSSGATDATVGRGLWIRNPRSFRVVGCQTSGNAAEGIYVDTNGTTAGLTIADCTVRSNGREGIQITDVGDVTIIGCDILSNSTVASNTRDGLSITPTVTTTGYQVIGNRFDGASQRNGLRTTNLVEQVTIIGNEYGTMGTGTVSLGDQQGSRFRLERDGTMLSNTVAGSIALRFRENADTNDRLILRTDGDIRWGDGTAAPDVRLFRQSADLLRTVDSVQVDTFFNLGAATAAGTTYMQMFEQTADPAAGAANTGRLFVKDNGAGKTQLCVRFNTGVVQVIATEP